MLFRAQGTSAKELWDALQPNRQKPYYKLYWNLTRMGGREPSEISRAVTLDDALAALGLATAHADDSAISFLAEIERAHGVRLPDNLSALIRRSGVAHAIHDCHPNAPRPFWMMEELVLRRNMRQEQLDGDHALTIMLPHQGNHEWAAVFDDDDQDARVYVGWETEDGKYEWHLTAPSIGMFFWDLAQTGLTWYQNTQFDGGKPVRCTDIGLVPVL